MLCSKTEIRVRYEETDQMGVVYHAKYFSWFEVARVHLLDEIGHPYKKLEKKGFFLPVLSCMATFYKPARFDDRLTIKTKAGFDSLLKLSLQYQVLRENDLIASGTTVHAFVSEKGKPVRPPSSFSVFFRSQSCDDENKSTTEWAT